MNPSAVPELAMAEELELERRVWEEIQANDELRLRRPVSASAAQTSLHILKPLRFIPTPDIIGIERPTGYRGIAKEELAQSVASGRNSPPIIVPAAADPSSRRNDIGVTDSDSKYDSSVQYPGSSSPVVSAPSPADQSHALVSEGEREGLRHRHFPREGRGFDVPDYDLVDQPAQMPRLVTKLAVHPLLQIAYLLPLFYVKLEDGVVKEFLNSGELKDNATDSELEEARSALQTKCEIRLALDVGVLAIGAAAYALSTGTLFKIKESALKAVAMSAVFSGIGLVYDLWILLRYSNKTKFKHRIRDVYGTYFFFGIQRRLSAVPLFVSSCCLLAFILIVAATAISWPVIIGICAFFAIVFLLPSLFMYTYLLFHILQRVWHMARAFVEPYFTLI